MQALCFANLHPESILPATVDAAILGQLQQITGMLQQQQEAAQPLTSRRRSRSPREAPHDDRRDSRRDVYRGEYREESRSDSYRTDYRQRDDYRSSDRGSHRDAYREEARASHRQSGRPALDYHRGDYSEDFRSDSHRTGYEHRDDYRSSYGGPRRDDYHEQARALPRQSNHRPAFDSQRGAADYPGMLSWLCSCEHLLTFFQDADTKLRTVSLRIAAHLVRHT